MKKYFVFLIFLLTFYLRFYSLLNFPPSLFSDEVDAGYQAMTFNRNSSDYFGNKFPIHFHSFSDWRTSAYIYSVAFFDRLHLNPELAVRLPSVIFGSLSVILFYQITGSLIAALVLCLSPWSIHYSRTGFEVSGMLFCFLAAILHFKRYLKDQHYYHLLIFTFFISLSTYFYSTAKLFIPLVLLTIICVWHRPLSKLTLSKIFWLIISLIIFFTPQIIDTVSGRSGYRFSYISIFTEPHREQVTDSLRYQDILLDHPGEIGVRTPLLSYILHNKYQLIIARFISNYIKSFSPEFLFLSGDANVRHGFGGHGLLYVIDIVLLIIGLFYFTKKPNKLGIFFFILFILAPIPFSLTRDSDSAHATRLILMLPSLVYFISAGLKHKIYLIPLYLLLFINFWHYYRLHYAQDSAALWHSNLKETVIASNKYSDRTIYYSDSFEPFLPFFLFYYPYYPDFGNLTDHITPENNDYFSGQSLDQKYYFGHINWSSVPADPDLIFVIPENEYKNLGQSDFFITLDIIPKRYLSAPSFYLLSPKPPSTP